MASDEQVLVVERAVFEQLGHFDGVMTETRQYLDGLFAPGVPRFMPRQQAETDPSFKQLIPYVLLAHDGRYLSYVRGKRAGETRLVGQRSIGIGGHINPVDNIPLFEADFRQTYQAAVEREVAEEVDVQTGHADQVIALINDDSNEVGSVHLGVVHLWSLEAPRVEKREQMITQMGFMTAQELAEVKDAMETWSQLCLEHLLEMQGA